MQSQYRALHRAVKTIIIPMDNDYSKGYSPGAATNLQDSSFPESVLSAVHYAEKIHVKPCPHWRL